MSAYSFYTSKKLKPSGWLKRQLEIQAAGLSGNLDKIWPDVRDSAWIGGDRDGWERVPYWLDGFIPLAFLLEDEDMIKRAKKYIDCIISKQRADGWICPCEDEERPTYDTWAVLLISKILTVWYDCSGDERIPEVLYRTMKNYYELLENGTVKLFDWAKFRWYEGFIALDFLYSRYNEEWIKKLASILKEQGTDYTEYIETWKRPLNKWTYYTHIVNLTMMLKSEAVSCELLGEEYTDLAEKLRSVLYSFNGTPVGLFTGDECLSGISPVQGSELCSVVELMYSYELLYAYTGDKKWAERLEVVALNALPAAFDDDMWAHQYDQMSNQIAAMKFPGKSIFRTNSSDAHIFGLEPNFGCCTANLSQGYPKLVLSTFMHKNDVIESVVPIPSELSDDGVVIKLETNYPFENTLKYEIKTNRDFTFRARIPSFAKNLTVNGRLRAKKEYSERIKAGTEKEIVISFETVPYLEKRPGGLFTAKCGSLVYSLPIAYKKKMREYTKNGVERKFPYCDYEYIPLSDWNYAFAGKELKKEFSGVSDIPFSSEKPPVTLEAELVKINWEYFDGYETVPAKYPSGTEAVGEKEKIRLYPYGCAKLRMTEMSRAK